LQRCYEKQRVAVGEWGKEVARKYVQRIDILRQCRSIEDLGLLPALRFHPLEGRRKGQYAIKLTGAVRLIVVFEDRAMQIVRVEEVVDYHGE
jgi:proteic killer suppression protein